MPTKFLVLWQQAVFFESADSLEEKDSKNYDAVNHELVLQCENFTSLEDAMRCYNRVCADPVNQEVLLMVGLKEFKQAK